MRDRVRARVDGRAGGCVSTAIDSNVELEEKVGKVKASRGQAQRRLSRQRRSLLPTSASQLSVRVHGAVGLCFIVAVIVALLVLVLGFRVRVDPSSGDARLQLQRNVAALFAGIPQHGVVLGHSTAPVTLQVFVDLEDHGDGTYWFDEMLPPILEKFVRTNLVRLEFLSFKTDTLNSIPFMMQQTSAMAAGSQDLLWNYAATFMNEQGTEFTNYVTEEFLRGIAKQISGLELVEWERSRTATMEKLVVADDSAAREAGFYDTPAFRIGRTGGKMRDLPGSTVEDYHKYIVRTRPSGERYIAGISPEWQHPVSLVDAADVKKAVEELI
jgi:protein-disulfide isomerase